MSYILDAIKKSDQQRQRGAAPTLLTAQAATLPPKQPALLFYGVLAAALVCAGIVIGWLRPWQPEQPAPNVNVNVEPIAVKPLEPGAQRTTPASLPVLPQTNRKPEQELPVQKAAPAMQPVPASASPVKKQDMSARNNTKPLGMPPQVMTVVPGDTVTPVSEKPVDTGLTDAKQEQRVMEMAELPLSIQQEIPSMSISLHAYSSKPKDRIVSINDRLLREGEYPASGLRLEQITPDGMIVSYKGYRFHRGVQ